MRRGHLLTALIGAALLTIIATPAEARRGDRLLTEPGVLTLGGRFAFELLHVNPDGGNSQTGVMLNFSPSFGGFVIRNLLLEGSLNVKVGLGDLYDKTSKVVGFSFGLQYLFNFRSIVVPYLGFRLGPGFSIPTPGDTSTSLTFGVPAGILISLNERVGLLIGSELTVAVGVGGPQKGTLLSFPFGYLGVNAYF